MRDDGLELFARDGVPPLSDADASGFAERDGARIWYAAYGAGAAVVLLHGGLGHGENWSHQLPALVGAGYRAILIDSRGHGRSSRDDRPYAYEVMAGDVLAVMDALHVRRAAVVGWSDGAILGLILAMRAPERVAGVFAYGVNMDLSGVKEMPRGNPLLRRAYERNRRDYERLSPTPEDFKAFAAAVGAMMATQPTYTATDLAAIVVPVAIVWSADDEFIHAEHAAYLVRAIPGARSIELRDVTHFAPLQRPVEFDRAMLPFLRLAFDFDDAAVALGDDDARCQADEQARCDDAV